MVAGENQNVIDCYEDYRGLYSGLCADDLNEVLEQLELIKRERPNYSDINQIRIFFRSGVGVRQES